MWTDVDGVDVDGINAGLIDELLLRKRVVTHACDSPVGLTNVGSEMTQHHAGRHCPAHRWRRRIEAPNLLLAALLPARPCFRRGLGSVGCGFKRHGIDNWGTYTKKMEHS